MFRHADVVCLCLVCILCASCGSSQCCVQHDLDLLKTLCEVNVKKREFALPG